VKLCLFDRQRVNRVAETKLEKQGLETPATVARSCFLYSSEMRASIGRGLFAGSTYTGDARMLPSPPRGRRSPQGTLRNRACQNLRKQFYDLPMLSRLFGLTAKSHRIIRRGFQRVAFSMREATTAARTCARRLTPGARNSARCTYETKFPLLVCSPGVRSKQRGRLAHRIATCGSASRKSLLGALSKPEQARSIRAERCLKNTCRLPRGWKMQRHIQSNQFRRAFEA
jgi:hypothetical protein